MKRGDGSCFIVCVFYGQNRKDGQPRSFKSYGAFCIWMILHSDDGVLRLLLIKSPVQINLSSTARLCVMPLTCWLHFKTKAPSAFLLPFFQPGSFMGFSKAAIELASTNSRHFCCHFRRGATFPDCGSHATSIIDLKNDLREGIFITQFCLIN